jgi:hypothetical protein
MSISKVRRRPTPLAMASTALAACLLTGALAEAHDHDHDERRWRGPVESTLPPPPGTGRLRNVAQGMCLDVAGWAAPGNANVQLWDCNNDPDQVWSFAGAELRDVLTGACLDVAGYDGAKGANVDVFRCEGMDDQRWTLVPRGQGTFELHNLKRDLCLDVVGKAGGRGDNVMLWACDGGADQTWRWEPYAPPRGPDRRPVPPGPPPRRPSAPPEMEVPPPPPPPRAREWRHDARPMNEDSFRALVAAVNREGFAEGKLAVIEQAASRNFFRVGQLRVLLDQLAFSATKLRALELGAPRLVDPENAFMLHEAFTFSADKERAREILKRNGY